MAEIGTAEIGTAAIGMVATGAAIGTTITITLMISFSSGALAFPSSAIRMAMDITLTAMAMLPTVTDMAPGIMGMVQDTTDMATATTATAITVTATTAMVSTAAVITLAIAPTEVDQTLPVCSDNYLGPVTIVVKSTESWDLGRTMRCAPTSTITERPVSHAIELDRRLTLH